MAATVASVVTLSSVPSPLVSLLLPEVDAVRLTITVTEVEAVPLETTTEVAPVATPVMTPEPLTVAMLLSWLLKVRLWLAEAGDTLPVMVLEEPGLSTT